MPIAIDLTNQQKASATLFSPSLTGSSSKSTHAFFNTANHTVAHLYEPINLVLTITHEKEKDEFINEMFKANEILEDRINDVPRLDNTLKKYGNQTILADEFTTDLYSDTIQRPTKNKEFHHYMKNLLIQEPISALLLAQSAQGFNGLIINKENWDLYQLNQMVNEIKNNKPSIDTMNNYQVYQFANIHALNGFGIAGKVYLHPTYALNHLFVHQQANLDAVEQIVITPKQLLQQNMQKYGTQTIFLVIDVFSFDLNNSQYQVNHTTFDSFIGKDDFQQLNAQAILESFKNQNVEKALVFQSNLIDKAEEQVELYFKVLETNLMARNYTLDITNTISYLLIRLLGSIEALNTFDMQTMRNIYNKTIALIENYPIDNRALSAVRSSSILITLYSQLEELEKIKTQLTSFHAQNDVVKQQMIQSTKYSKQQKNIILSEEPLIIGQAGAGAGKSHTILGRIQYLKDQGINLNNVLVLSFTNVAAENIKERWHEIKSVTIASMIDEIYQTNFKHELSQPGTVNNALELIVPNNPYFTNKGYQPEKVKEHIQTLRTLIKNLNPSRNHRQSKSNNAYMKELSNVIDQNFELTIDILNSIGQTTLDLEPIIILNMLHHRQNQLQMPAKYQNIQFIFTDESQDISAFEYIFVLQLAMHYRSQLTIVGDGSQTLYEFRSADSRCLNALEQSGIFTTYKLDTNYRSKQEILSMANQFLKEIEANKFANIQLHANKLTNVTESSFKEAVQMLPINIQTIKEKIVTDNGKGRTNQYNVVKEIFNNYELKKYIIDKVKKNEQIAFLAWSRNEKNAAKAALEELFKQKGINQEVVDISSKQHVPSTAFSKLAKLLMTDENVRKKTESCLTNYVNKTIKKVSFLNILSSTWENALSSGSSRLNEYAIAQFIKDLDQLLSSQIHEYMLNELLNKRITNKQYIEEMVRVLIDSEIRNNSIRNTYLKNQKATNYDELKVIVSTIHGAKGLEFDHVIVLYNETATRSLSNKRTLQEELRLYFVALSRAKQTELIINTFYKDVNDEDAIFLLKTPMRTAYLRTINELKTTQIESEEEQKIV